MSALIHHRRDHEHAGTEQDSLMRVVAREEAEAAIRRNAARIVAAARVAIMQSVQRSKEGMLP